MRDGKFACGVLVGTRTWSPVWVLFAREKQAIARLGVRPRECAGSELDYRESTKSDLNARRSNSGPQPNDRTASIDERDINRELHEERMNAAARREDQRRVLGQVRSAEQSLVASRRVERGFNRPRHDAVVAGIANHPVSLRIGQQAVEEGRGSQAGLRTLSNAS